MIEFRQKIKELVTYILNPEERDEDVIENYTDTVMLACEEYHIKQLKLYGVRHRRELLISYNLDFYKGIKDVTLEDIEINVDKYLSNL